ncbi:MAG: NifU family protein [Candidatus Latescibacteria bacterium]|nr:NifU family protein [Candidatus Latescibacterota bacterium]
MKNKVKEIIEQTIRPALKADGGNIELVEITDTGIVRVKLQGACATCPFSQMTMTLGVEKTLKDAIPEIDRVELAV